MLPVYSFLHCFISMNTDVLTTLKIQNYHNGLHMCIEIIDKQVLFYNSAQRTPCTSVSVHIVDSLRGFIFNDCLFSSIVQHGICSYTNFSSTK